MKKVILAAALIAMTAPAPAIAAPSLRFCNFMGNWNGMIMAILHGAPLTCVYR